MVTCRTSQSAITQATTGRTKRAWSPTEESYVRSRTKAELKRLDLARKLPGNQDEAQNLAELQRVERLTAEYQSVHVDMVNLLPGEYSKSENYLARVLGIHKKKLGLSDTGTQAGDVKLQIADMMASSKALIDVTARYAFKKHTSEAISAIHSLLKSRQVPKGLADEFINHVAEVAISPRQRMAYGNTPAVNMVLTKRHNKMMDEARKLGLTDEDMDTIVGSLTNAMKSIDDTHAMANILGAATGTVENVGYVPRMFTEQAEKYFSLKSMDPPGFNRAVGTSSVQKSRESNLLIAEDYEVLAELLVPGRHKTWASQVEEMMSKSLIEGDNGPTKYSDILAKFDGDEDLALRYIGATVGKQPEELLAIRSEGLEDAIAELHTLADDGVAFTQRLHKDLTGAQLDELVDAGILHKVEMTSREVVDYMSRQYELPYQKASGMLEYDLQKRIDRYADVLRTSASESNLIKNLTDEGVTKGWAIPAAMMGPEHSGFVKLSGVDVTRFGVDPKVADSWEGLYVHPTVADQMKAYLDLSTNPGKLSQFANVWSYVLRNFNITTLLAQGVQFLSRNVIGGTINYLAGGGNLARVIPGIHDYVRAMKGGLESLDDTRPFLTWPGTDELITKREAFRRMFVKRGTDWVNTESGNSLGVGLEGTGVSKVANYLSKSIPLVALPKAIKAQMDMSQYIGKGWTASEAFKMGANQFNDYVKDVFAPIAYGNAVVDGGLKWAWMLSKLHTQDGVIGKVDDFASWVTGAKTYKSGDELFQDMDNYFVNAYTMGTAQKGLARYVIPFGTFAMASTPMAIRHAVRNPAQFMAYTRGIRMLHRHHMSDPDMREAGFAPWEMQSIPMTLVKDPKTNQVLSLFTTNVDMYGGTFAYLARQTQRVGRLTDGFVGSGPQDREQLRDPYSLIDFIQDQLKDNQNPVFGFTTELMAGKDSMGRDIETLKNTEVFGAKTDPTTFWLLSKLPGFSKWNRDFGGRGAITDSSGRIVDPAQPGLLGTPNRPATRSEEARYNAKTMMGDGAYGVLVDFLGLNVRTIDLAEGRQHTLNDVRFTIKTLKKKLATPELAPEQREVIANQILQLQVDEHRVSQWLQDKGVPDPKALRALQNAGLGVRELPMNPQVVNQYIQEYHSNVNTTPVSETLRGLQGTIPSSGVRLP